MRSIFDKIDRSKSNRLGRDDFELLLMALGYYVSSRDLDRCVRDISGSDSSDTVTFKQFFRWWTSDVDASYLKRK